LIASAACTRSIFSTRVSEPEWSVSHLIGRHTPATALTPQINDSQHTRNTMRRAFYSITPLALLVFLLARGPAGTLSGAPSAEGGVGGEAAVAARADVVEARRLLAAEAEAVPGEVRLALAGPSGGPLHVLSLTKETFLSNGAQALATTSRGEEVRVSVVRANGVNTSVRVADTEGREMTPLAVQYPIERDGGVREVAYYTAVHPALQSDALARRGESYVSRTLARAASRLAGEGVRVSPEVVRVAERLAVVEHADHKRFMQEDRGELFDEIRTLYALNAGDTYNYSVSTAGAGGMIQMIEPTYAATRARHPGIPLKADFVEGMRDHSNAAQVMLLYMQDTWDDLLKRDEVRLALASGVATQAELLSAGYNSNPARLPRYLSRGGHDWRTLIPRETQMYLRIYAAVDAQ
jgi:hypothetical protein